MVPNGNPPYRHSVNHMDPLPSPANLLRANLKNTILFFLNFFFRFFFFFKSRFFVPDAKSEVVRIDSDSDSLMLPLLAASSRP